MITFETDVRIERPIDEVFVYVSDPLNFPRWNSAVRAVRPTSGQEPRNGSTYSMERELPTGRAENELEVVAQNPPTEFTIRTMSGPTPFIYQYRLRSDNGETVLRLDARVELDSLAAIMAPLAGRVIKKGVDENFAVLREILEKRS